MLCRRRDIWSFIELTTIVSTVVVVEIRTGNCHRLARFGPLIGIS